MANLIYNSFLRDIQNGSIDLDTDTIKLMLVTSAYTPNIDTHTKRSDVTNEVVGVGYTAGGVTLAGKTVTQNNTDNTGVFDADNITIPTSTITARAGVLYKSRGGASSADELIGYLDFGSDIISTAGDFNITFNAAGILTLAQA
jgi:hypothetical protein